MPAVLSATRFRSASPWLLFMALLTAALVLVPLLSVGLNVFSGGTTGT